MTKVVSCSLHLAVVVCLTYQGLISADVELICLNAGFGYPKEMIDLFESLVGSLGPYHVHALNSSLFRFSVSASLCLHATILQLVHNILRLSMKTDADDLLFLTFTL